MFITTSRVDKSKINEFSANRQRNLGFEDEQPNKVLTLEMVEILVPFDPIVNGVTVQPATIRRSFIRDSKISVKAGTLHFVAEDNP